MTTINTDNIEITSFVNNESENVQQPNRLEDKVSETTTKAFQRKAAEAEDVRRRVDRPVLLRRKNSVAHLGPKGLTEKEAIQQKHTPLWKCIGRRPDIYGGYIYRFRIRPEYLDKRGELNKKGQEIADNIFPAIEPVRKRDVKDLEGFLNRYPEKFKMLGYECKSTKNGYVLYLPDKEALDARYEKFRQQRPLWNNTLDIASSEGIAGDLSFAWAYCTVDLLLSSGGEFLHDHTAHVIPTLSSIFDDPASYHGQRMKAVTRLVLPVHRTTTMAKDLLKNKFPEVEVNSETKKLLKKQLDKMETSLGVLVDRLWNDVGAKIERKKVVKKDLSEKLFAAWKDDEIWQNYGLKRFGDQPNYDDLVKCWEKMVALEQEHDALFAQPVA